MNRGRFLGRRFVFLLLVAGALVIPAASSASGLPGGGEAVSCTRTYTAHWIGDSVGVDLGGCTGNAASWSLRIPGDTCASSDSYRVGIYNTSSGEWFYHMQHGPYCTDGTYYWSTYDPKGNEANQVVHFYISAGCGYCIPSTNTAYLTATIYKA